MEQPIYALLGTITELTTLTGERIRPVRPALNTPLPHAWYTLSAEATTQYFSSPSSLTPYTLTIPVHARDLDQISSTMAAVKTILNGYNDATIKAIFFEAQQ